MRKYTASLVVIAGLTAIGCTTDSEVGAYEAALLRATTCGDVLTAIQEDALAKVDLQLKSFIDQDYYGWDVSVPVGVDFEAGGADDGRGAPPTTNGAAGEDADGPSGFSDTNRQVADVDEADIVKVGDGGEKLFVIRGNQFFELASWPPEATSVTGDLEIEGSPIEMFVEGDRAVVFSGVYGVEELDDGDLCAGYHGGPEPGLADVEGASYYCGRSYVKATVIGLGGDAHEVLREVYVDGWYTSSRRHDDVVRVVIQSSMQNPGTVPYLSEVLYSGPSYPETREAEIELARTWAAEAKRAIRETTLEQWLPVWGERIDGKIEEQAPQCADFYSPTPGLTNYGLTQILGFEIDGEGSTAVTTVLGQASHVYANRDALILAQPDWSWFERDTQNDQTAMHRFAVSADGVRTPYEGSGFVEGIVNDQFSIDERDGVIRVATTRTTWNAQSGDVTTPDIWVPPTTHNLVSTLRLDEGALEVIGKTPPLAEGERIFSARFLGDLGYIVTFRQVDPLFAIDLSDPENPTVLGELKIPGFSDYMHPLGDDHLLTIGRDVDEDTFRDNGTALQIFDVSDPTDPQLAHKRVLGEGYSEANHNHKAFNFYADKGLLAFPFVSYDDGFSSTLELWAVSIDTGFDQRGSVDHSDLVLDDCGAPYGVEEFYYYCGYEPQISRGVFIDDYIYSISHGGVKVHAVDDLTEDVATVAYSAL